MKICGMVTVMDNPKREMIKMAAKLFEERGYHKCSVQDIVEPLGITKGSFYYYFKNKEELLYFIHDDMINFLLERTEELLNLELSTEEKLYRIIENILQTIHHYKSNVFVFFQEMRYLSEDNLKRIKEKRDFYIKMVYKILTKEMEEGKLRKDLDPEIVMLGIFGMCNWAYQWYRKDGRLNVDEITNIFYQILKDGLIQREN